MSRYWNELSKDDVVWSYWASKHFDKNKNNSGELGLAETYGQMYKLFGRYPYIHLLSCFNFHAYLRFFDVLYIYIVLCSRAQSVGPH